MILDRTPECRIRRVVDDEHAFKVWIIEPRERIERSFEHLRRLAMGRHVDRDLGCEAFRDGRRCNEQAPWALPEGNAGDFLDTGERDHHQRDQKDNAETERKCSTEHEIMRLPEGEDGREPGADQIGGDRQRRGLAEGGATARQDRQRQQKPEQDGEPTDLPMVGIGRQSGPSELGLARGVEHAPIHADAAFVGLPGLVESLDDVVIDSDGLGAGDEIAQHRRLLDAPGIGVAHVVAAARPTELGDHDALAAVHVPQLIVDQDGALDGLTNRRPIPIGQDVGGDEVDRGRQLGRRFRLLLRLAGFFGLVGVGEAEPDVVGFTCGDRHRALALHPLDDSDEVVDRFFSAQHRLVADHDGVDVAIAARERNGGLDFSLIAGFVLVDPNAQRDLEPQLGGNRGHKLASRGRAVGPDGVSVWTEDLQIGADLLRGRAVAVVRMLGSRVRRIGDAGERSVDVGDGLMPLQQCPQAGVNADDERHHSSDGAHRRATTRGREYGPEPVP